MPATIADNLNLNGPRCWRSFTSQTCPACSRRKPENLVLCLPCTDKLTPEARQLLQYARYSIDDYCEAIGAALDELRRRKFKDPPPAVRAQLLAVTPGMFKPVRISESRASCLCPACGGRKLPGKRLDAGCVGVLRAAYYRASRSSDRVKEAEFQLYLSRMRGPEAPVVCQLFYRAFRLMGVETFYVPLPT